jgi:hypothetical protein
VEASARGADPDAVTSDAVMSDAVTMDALTPDPVDPDPVDPDPIGPDPMGPVAIGPDPIGAVERGLECELRVGQGCVRDRDDAGLDVGHAEGLGDGICVRRGEQCCDVQQHFGFLEVRRTRGHPPSSGIRMGTPPNIGARGAPNGGRNAD